MKKGHISDREIIILFDWLIKYNNKWTKERAITKIMRTYQSLTKEEIENTLKHRSRYKF